MEQEIDNLFLPGHGNGIDLTVLATLVFKMCTYILSECNTYAGGDVTRVRMHDCCSVTTFSLTLLIGT
jgi:hypothetical protein